MTETQRDIRVAEDTAGQVEESNGQQQASVATAARMLANPRRIRRT